MKTEIYFADIETNKFKEPNELIDFEKESYELIFKLGCIWNLNYSFYTFDKEAFSNEMIAISKHKKQRKIIYFHNLSFDSKLFSESLNSYFDKVIPIKANSKILAIKYKLKYKDKKKLTRYRTMLEVRDSYSLLITSIKKLGKMVKIPKLKFDFDYSKTNEAIEYCFQDCKIIYYAIDYLKDFLENYFKQIIKIDKFPITISSLSKKMFELFYPYVFNTPNLKIEKSLRHFYYGGHTEPFNFNIFKNVVGLDINSLYSHVLCNNLFANNQVSCFKTDKIIKDDSILAYKCIIKENQFYPLFPERLESGKIIFKNGIKEVIISVIEYNYFKEFGILDKEIKIIEIKEAYKSTIIQNFKNYFEKVYTARKSFKESHPYNYFLKIFLNTPYGKFGQKPLRKEYEIINSIDDVNDNSLLEVFDDNTFLKTTEKFNKNLRINLLNAVLTTNYARFELWKYLKFCYENNITVIYVDTDSLYIQEKDIDIFYEYNLIGNGLGKLKIEAKGKKMLAIDSKEYIILNDDNKEMFVKFKGVKKEYLKSLNDIKKHIKEGTNVNLIGSIFYCSRRKDKFNMIHVIKKHKNSFFSKREILTDGTTIPLTENENIDIEIKNKKFILSKLEIL